MNTDEIQQALLDMMIRTAEIKAEWDLLRKKILSNTRLPRSIRLAINLVAARANDKLNGIADHVITGMDNLEDGLLGAARMDLGTCMNEMMLNETADRMVALMVRKTYLNEKHDQH